MNNIDWGLAGQYTTTAIIICVAVYLWILLARAAARADEREWEQHTLRAIARYLIERERGMAFQDCPPVLLGDAIDEAFAADSPLDDDQLTIRRLAKSTQQNNRPLAS